MVCQPIAWAVTADRNMEHFSEFPISTKFHGLPYGAELDRYSVDADASSSAISSSERFYPSTANFYMWIASAHVRVFRCLGDFSASAYLKLKFKKLHKITDKKYTTVY